MDTFVNVAGHELEYELIPASPGFETAPTLVFLHEGLGSLRLWRAFPGALRAATGSHRTLLYSRRGYGRSAPADEPRPVSFMHDEALEVLPDLLAHLEIDRPVLIGHSDGGSISIIYAGAGHPVAGLVLLAPHVFVEDCTIERICAAREAFLTGGLRAKLASHHADVDHTFLSWCDVWLRTAFRDWNIESYLCGVQAPTVVLQGRADPYGTEAQIDAIERGVSGPVSTVLLDGVRHAPHLEAPAETVECVAALIRRCRGEVREM